MIHMENTANSELVRIGHCIIISNDIPAELSTFKYWKSCDRFPGKIQ